MDVFLIQWAADDLGVSHEIEKLSQLFSSAFHFTTHSRRIPSQRSEDYLVEEILNFRRGKGKGNLIILYYGGHADGTPQECIWRANIGPNAPTLNWHNVQGLVLGHHADVLLILDCCFSALAVKTPWAGDNWFLGASAKESQATGVSWKSFTSALTRQLKRYADRYWTDSMAFTVQSIHHALLAREQDDLPVTPIISRLTDHECYPTDLTPLQPRERPRLHPHNTVPIMQQSDDPSCTITSHTTLPIGNHAGFSGSDALTVDFLQGETQMVRLSNLPERTSPDDIYHWFRARIGWFLNHEEPLFSWIGPMVTSSQGKVSIILFSSAALAIRALSISDRLFQAQADMSKEMIEIDTRFQGLTCLHPSLLSREPMVDIIFVHGEHGHAISSFACYSIGQTKEDLWPSAELPKTLEAVGIYSRVMTFGWSAGDWLNPLQPGDKVCTDIINNLRRARSGNPKRPMVFVGLGVGGLLIKKVVIEEINFGFNDLHFKNTIKACFFFAVPHNGLNQTNDFVSILATMQSISQRRVGPSEDIRRHLEARNSLISNSSFEFDQIRKEHNISCVSFYENLPTASTIIVPKDCAILDRNPGKAHAIEAEYRNIAKLSKGNPNLTLVLNVMCDTLKDKLGLGHSESSVGPRPSPETKTTTTPSKPDPEKVYPRLKRYDTVFLVDDSGSMLGPRWDTTAAVLAKIASIAVQYDKDGVDVRFFNSSPDDEERLNLDTAEKVNCLFKKVSPEGPTPTADVLDAELNNYIYKYRGNRNIRGLNLIILTDGEPDEDQDVANVIVEFTKELKEASAPRDHVGIQFVQIGGDEAASEFLRGLDDDLQNKHNLDRDVSLYQATPIPANMHRLWILCYGKTAMKTAYTRKSYWEES